MPQSRPIATTAHRKCLAEQWSCVRGLQRLRPLGDDEGARQHHATVTPSKVQKLAARVAAKSTRA